MLNKSTYIFLIILSFTSVTELMADRTGAHSKAEYPKQYTLKPGDIGVLYLVNETKKEYELKAVFPSYSVNADFPNFYRGGPPYDGDPKKYNPQKKQWGQIYFPLSKFSKGVFLIPLYSAPERRR